MINDTLTNSEKELINYIQRKTMIGNLDNISRTQFYDDFYLKHTEIIWPYLASFVSRNAGWNMTDLEGDIFKNILPKDERDLLYLTYERANWLIFSDAFPQLCMYEASKKRKEPLFYLLSLFHVSKFMEEEWLYFWEEKDIERLCRALIINEQHVIQKPVIEDPFFSKKVFKSILFTIEEKLHFSTVFFPTLDGLLYGFSVYGFRQVKNRIELGKRLSWLLFHSKEHNKMREFVNKVEHTGSRFDYEQFIEQIVHKRTPELRSTFPVIPHHRHDFTDWYDDYSKQEIEAYFKNTKKIEKYDLTDWYFKKQQQLQLAATIEQKILELTT